MWFRNNLHSVGFSSMPMQLSFQDSLNVVLENMFDHGDRINTGEVQRRIRLAKGQHLITRETGDRPRYRIQPSHSLSFFPSPFTEGVLEKHLCLVR